jgi:hypothetical protein
MHSFGFVTIFAISSEFCVAFWVSAIFIEFAVRQQLIAGTACPQFISIFGTDKQFM